MDKVKSFRIFLKQMNWLVQLVRAFNYCVFRMRLLGVTCIYLIAGDKRLPPPKLRYQVHRALDEESYSAVGQLVAKQLATLLESLNAVSASRRLLDFGCGPGRVLIPLSQRLPQLEYYGCDTNDTAILWAKNNASQIGTFSVIQPGNETPYSTNYFDLIICNSVFTHLDEEMQDFLLVELYRLLKPDGLLFATVHGEKTFRHCSEREIRELNNRGFTFRVEQRRWFKLDQLPAYYQTAFHTEEYIRNHWGKYFKTAHFVEGGLADHHDLWVLRK